MNAVRGQKCVGITQRNLCLGKKGVGREGLGKASAMSVLLKKKESKYLLNLGGGILGVCYFLYIL